jgi:hypothetical protein
LSEVKAPLDEAELLWKQALKFAVRKTKLDKAGGLTIPVFDGIYEFNGDLGAHAKQHQN